MGSGMCDEDVFQVSNDNFPRYGGDGMPGKEEPQEVEPRIVVEPVERGRSGDLLGATSGEGAKRFDAEGRELAECGCLRRTLPPAAPTELPWEATVENAGKIEAWLKNLYASSTFNTCKPQPLPMMKGAKAMRILMRKDAIPVAVHRPAQIPVHWQQQVRDDIERDICLGVLEQVPQNTPVTWYSRMHVVAKKNGEPRRVVDLRPVNAASLRQTHYVEPPYSQARSIPPRTVRFTSDAWNGYHSVPLDPRDRHVTTFITPWGRL